jgi:hypothetical protein
MFAVNHVPVQDIAASPTGCCPVFQPQDWDGQIFVFEQKPFLKVSTRSLFHIPLNMGPVMQRASEMIERADAGNKREYLMLSHESSPWKADHYLSVEKEIPDAEIVPLSGRFLAKVFEGSFNQQPQWHEQLMQFAAAQGHRVLDTYFFYTTCPKCAKVYGKNYVVGFAQIA